MRKRRPRPGSTARIRSWTMAANALWESSLKGVGREMESETTSGMPPSSRKKWRGRDATSGLPCMSASDEAPGQWWALSTKSVLHWIADGVDHLVDDVAGVDEPHYACLLGGPEVLPAAAEGVLAFGKQLVKVLEECRIAAVRVLDAGVVVVAHRRSEDDANAVALGGDGEAIDEGIVRLAGPVA